MIRHSLLIAARINRQFMRDRRFLGMSLLVPLILMFLLKYVIDSLPGLVRFGIRVSDFSILIAAYLVHFLAYVLATIVLVRDRTAGTLSRMFVSGYRRREIVSGYVTGYSTVATAQTALVLVSTRYLFDVKIEKDIVAVVLTVLSLAIVSVGLGLFLSNFARNEGQVFPFIPMVIIPSALLSGMIIPISDLPSVLQWCSYLVPLTWAVKVLRSVVVDGSSFYSVLTPFFVLVGFGLALLVLASFTLREKE